MDSRNSWQWKYQCFILTFLLHYFSLLILLVQVRPRHQWRTADHDSGLPRQTVQIICWSAFVHCQSRVAEVRGDRGDEAARSWLSVAITIRKYFHRSNTANKTGIGHPVPIILISSPDCCFLQIPLFRTALHCGVMLINLRCQIMIMNAIMSSGHFKWKKACLFV